MTNPAGRRLIKSIMKAGWRTVDYDHSLIITNERFSYAFSGAFWRDSRNAVEEYRNNLEERENHAND